MACTLLPRTTPDFNPFRAVFNSTVRAAGSQYYDAIADFAADPVIGIDAAASDTTWFSDTIHPTAAAQRRMRATWAAAVGAL